MEVVAELTAGVTHDFNNLLGIVISNLDMLESRVPKDSLASEMVTAALRASLSGVALNRQLRAFLRRQKLMPMNVDIQKTIESLKPLLYPILGYETIEADSARPALKILGTKATVDSNSPANEPQLDIPVLAKPVRRQELAEHVRKALSVSA